jgi:hypothetical protein
MSKQRTPEAAAQMQRFNTLAGVADVMWYGEPVWTDEAKAEAAKLANEAFRAWQAVDDTAVRFRSRWCDAV